ncbi:hypothetical protein EST38_g14588 [Candolleomyces aberdarensis]|uniref:Nucleoplasmin-like domain-containing protein n=1 Tax=Candolleomyces aberdarensis TaxID=2316362 RepID=A0A4Q2CWW5_9AGAR|nr:hypothetical protein EST38_g14588 [Candolleomyces aberdarensis]
MAQQTGGYWSLNISAGETVVFTPDTRITITRASVGLELPEDPGPVRSCLNFGYVDAHNEERFISIATFVNGLVENHNFNSFHLEVDISYTFESEYYNIDLVGYFSERVEAPPVKTRARNRSSTRASSNGSGSGSAPVTRKRTASNASSTKPPAKKTKASTPPVASASTSRITRRSSLPTIPEKGEEDDSSSDGEGEAGGEREVVQEAEAEPKAAPKKHAASSGGIFGAVVRGRTKVK